MITVLSFVSVSFIPLALLATVSVVLVGLVALKRRKSSPEDSKEKSSREDSKQKSLNDFKVLKNRGVVYLMRGLPGSGKSYLAEHLSDLKQSIIQHSKEAPNFGNLIPNSPRPLPISCESETQSSSIASTSLIVSADHYFMNEKGYEFDFKKLNLAHTACFSNFVDGLTSGIPEVVVDNTNTQLWEYKNYFKVARALGYTVFIVEVHCRMNNRILELFAQRNTHKVPLSSISNMAKRWEKDDRAVFIPPYGIPNQTNA